jgi:hypothetical protein
MFGYLVRGSVDRQGKDGDARTLAACVLFELRNNRLKEPGHLPGKGTPMIDHTAFVFDPDGHNIEAVCREPA